MKFSDVMSAVPASENGGSMVVSGGWFQGRTLFGGLTAAIALEAVLKQFPDLPPIRTAQVTFVGPIDGNCEVRTTVLRRGKSVVTVRSEVFSQSGVGTSCIFVFGASRRSMFDQSFIPMPDVPSVELSENYITDDCVLKPDFISYFDCLLAQGERPIRSNDVYQHYMWAKHKDELAKGPSAILAIADMPAPALASAMPKLAMMSTITWMLNFVQDQLDTGDGWWLVETKAENGKDGYSSENTHIWNSEGEIVVTARQNVAVFI